MAGDAAPRVRGAIKTITALGLGGIIIFLIGNALLSGSGLDELWTLQLSDTGGGLIPLILDRWLHDTHPPLFNAWSTLLTMVGVTSIPIARLLTNIPPLIMMIAAARRFVDRSPEEYIFHAVLLLLILSVPVTVWAFATYRSYFWQIAALTILAQVGRHISVADHDLSPKRDPGLGWIAICATAGSIMFHYVGGLIGAVFALAIILCALARGFKRWAALLIKTMLVSGILTASFAWYQAQYWILELDHSWIQPESGSGFGEVMGLVGSAIFHNPVPLIGLRWIRNQWNARDGIYVVTVLGALLVALFILFHVDVQKPIVIGRYMAGIPVLLCAAMGVLATKFQNRKLLFGLLAATSAAAVIGPFFFYGANRHWNADAKKIAKIARSCPTTKVYAATGWLLRDGSMSNTARREDPVFARGYILLGQTYGFVPEIIGRNGPTHAMPGDCPILLWMEHVPDSTKVDAKGAVKAAGLLGIENSRLSLIHGESGLIIRADPR
jgi:hypothetical protein